jgi:hypothetical protein
MPSPAIETTNILVMPEWEVTDSGIESLWPLLKIVNDPAMQLAVKNALKPLAQDYLRRRLQEQATPSPSEQRSRLEAVSDCARQLARLLIELDGLTSDAMFVLSLQNSRRFDGGTFCLKRFRHDLDWLRAAATTASDALKPRSGPHSATDLVLLVIELCRLWKWVTGKNATHNPNLKVEYKGMPLSPAGRFVEGVIKLIDPAVRPTQISTAMAIAVRHLKLEDQGPGVVQKME